MPPPQGLFRGKADRSRSLTAIPAEASARAAVAPAGPAPTTTTGSAGEEVANIVRNRKNRPDFAKEGHYTGNDWCASAVASPTALWDSECAPTRLCRVTCDLPHRP